MNTYTHFIITIDVLNGKSYTSTKISLSDNNFDPNILEILIDDNKDIRDIKKLIITDKENNKTVIFNNNILLNSIITLTFITENE